MGTYTLNVCVQTDDIKYEVLMIYMADLFTSFWQPIYSAGHHFYNYIVETVPRRSSKQYPSSESKIKWPPTPTSIKQPCYIAKHQCRNPTHWWRCDVESSIWTPGSCDLARQNDQLICASGGRDNLGHGQPTWNESDNKRAKCQGGISRTSNRRYIVQL